MSARPMYLQTDDRFSLVCRKAEEWSLQADLPVTQRQAAKILRLMVRRVESDPQADLTADKSIKVLGCYLCRLTGNAICSRPVGSRQHCPLGFRAD